MKLTNDWLIETCQGIQHLKESLLGQAKSENSFSLDNTSNQLVVDMVQPKGPKLSYHQWSNFTSCCDKNAVFIFFHICKSLVWLEPLYKIKLLLFPTHSWKRKGLGWLHCKQSSVWNKKDSTNDHFRHGYTAKCFGKLYKTMAPQ